jgi:hypothetical protein
MEQNQIQYGQYCLDLEREFFEDDKEKTKFVKKCVQLCRYTPEYREWVDYLRDSLGYKTCDISGENGDEVTVEIHHHPITIFDIGMIIVDTYLKKRRKFSSLNIVNDMLMLHYNDKVGFIPICTTFHEKYHNGFLIIPPKFIHGQWDYILTNGYEVSQDVLDRAARLMDPVNNQFIGKSWKNVNPDGTSTIIANCA